MIMVLIINKTVLAADFLDRLWDSKSSLADLSTGSDIFLTIVSPVQRGDHLVSSVNNQTVIMMKFK